MATKLVPQKGSRVCTFEEPDNNSEQCDDDCLHEVQELIEELSRLPETCNRPPPYISNPEDIHPEDVEKVFITNIEGLSDGSNRTCANCSKARRVEDMSSLERGQHISIPGQYFNSTSLDKHKSAYQHHAIIKSINCKTNYSANVNLIHFAQVNDVMKVCEETLEFNLRYDELCVIEYQYPRHDPDVIVQRAESVLKQSENSELFKHYNVLDKNCEHFAIWCVLGKEDSLQANTFWENLQQTVFNTFGGFSSNIANWILKVLGNSADEITSYFSNSIRAPLAVLGGCSAVYLIYCIIKTVYLIKRYRVDKTICWHCLKQELLDRWLKFGVYGMTSAITFVIVNFALPLVGPAFTISIGLVLVLGATALTVHTPAIRKAVWSPVQYSEKEIKNLLEIKPGDIVSLTYWYFSHLVVVSEVKWDSDPKKGMVRGIHYSLPSLFSTREIAEETFQVDLERSKVNLVQFNSLFVFSREEVVDRARTRIGEQKWNMRTNISDHVCQWAKIKPQHCFEASGDLYETKKTTPSRNLSFLLVGKEDVHLMSEIQPGDVVEYGSNKGIIVKLEDVKRCREFDMDIVQCFNGRVIKILHKIDLNKHYLVVHRYHPVHCVSNNERVKKALGMIDKSIPLWKPTDFIKNIVLRHIEKK